MASAHSSTSARLERMGLRLLQPEAAIAALQDAVLSVSALHSPRLPIPQPIAVAAPVAVLPQAISDADSDAAPLGDAGAVRCERLPIAAPPVVAVLGIKWQRFLEALPCQLATSPFFSAFAGQAMAPVPGTAGTAAAGVHPVEPISGQDRVPGDAGAALSEVSSLVTAALRSIVGEYIS